VIAPQVLDCNAVVTETSSMVRRLISENIELRCKLAPDLWSIKADSGQIVQVILNLCVNSRDAIASGGSITISTRNLAQEQGFVEISVSDSGTGIPLEVQERLFEPFFTTKEHGKGTGLGLATVYGIVQQAGGHIRFESTPGEGTTFHVCLPRCLETASDGETPAAHAVTAERFRVMVVEDEDALRDAISDQLRNSGYEVISAANGEAALELLPQYPDLAVLVCDLVMPRMGGLELARLAEEMIPELHIVFMSGHADQTPSRTKGEPSHFVFLQKPFPMSMLLSHIAELRQFTPAIAVPPQSSPQAGSAM
jgi:two-component system cell cycle sensor histidine kinase/response regulator CckA